MRILIFSDVHANLEALEAMAAYTQGRYDTCLCLGDLVGYGADPNLAAEWVRSHAPLIIRGNHDRAGADLHGVAEFNSHAATAAHWTHDQLHPDLRTWLSHLPQGPFEWNRLQLAHGSPLDEDQYISNAADAAGVFAATDPTLTFIGHTHLQGGFALGPSGVRVRVLARPAPPAAGQGEVATLALRLRADTRYLLNPGSVGQPRDGDWRAAFALYDTEAATITFVRLPYALSVAQEKILAAGLPPSLAARLALGR